MHNKRKEEVGIYHLPYVPNGYCIKASTVTPTYNKCHMKNVKKWIKIETNLAQLSFNDCVTKFYSYLKQFMIANIENA